MTPSTFISCLKKYFESNFTHALRNNCSERNCRLVLDNCRERIIIKGEEIRKNNNESICDNIIFISKNKIIIINVELKSKTIDYGKIINKFRQTPIYTKNFLNCCKKDFLKYTYIPIILAKSWNVITKRKFKNQKVRFENKNYDLILSDCGIRISIILSKYT
ncbi:MAG: hypothetical protein GF316_11635 [Candidatus Lokiarchaeota archaeon]|nr:hypothetical protein [Candidatus Lokiarchaeota archaeon]